MHKKIAHLLLRVVSYNDMLKNFFQRKSRAVVNESPIRRERLRVNCSLQREILEVKLNNLPLERLHQYLIITRVIIAHFKANCNIIGFDSGKRGPLEDNSEG
jgi:hypothetical protein